MKKIAIIVAMQNEYDLVQHIIENRVERDFFGGKCCEGTLMNYEAVLLKCGIGKVNAAMQLTQLIATEHPDYVINSGVAGGVDKRIRPGDVVVGVSCCYHDVWCGSGEMGQVQGLPLYFEANQSLLDAAKAVNSSLLEYGLICTGDQFITDVAQLTKIKLTFPNVLAVDMESAALAQVAHLLNVPFMSIRVVSDTPGMVHDNTTQYFNFFEDAPRRTFEILKSVIANLK